ncbi:MAG: TetR/AcrR family transcriptional regulator [Xanthobacteraceae bacterium]
MIYRRTEKVVRRLAQRHAAILAAARAAADEGGMAAVQIAPVAERAGIAAGTVYRYFPAKSDLVAALVASVADSEIGALRHAADAAPGPLSAIAAAVTTFAARALARRRLAWAVIAEPVDPDVEGVRLGFRRALAAELQRCIETATRGGQLPAQDAALAAAALVGALLEGLIGPLAPHATDEPARRRESVQAMTLIALRAVGVVDAHARGLVMQTAVPDGEATPETIFGSYPDQT